MQAMAENVHPFHGTDALMNEFKPLGNAAALVACNSSLQSALDPTPRWQESLGRPCGEADHTFNSWMG
jgi:hypothetical protein